MGRRGAILSPSAFAPFPSREGWGRSTEALDSRVRKETEMKTATPDLRRAKLGVGEP